MKHEVYQLEFWKEDQSEPRTITINNTDKIISYKDRHNCSNKTQYPDDWGMTRVWQRVQNIIDTEIT